MKHLITTIISCSLCVMSEAQNVGVNTATPKTSLDIKGGIRNQPLYLTGSGTGIIIPDNQSNINLSGSFSGQFSATVKNPEDGQRLIIDNVSNQTGVIIGGPDIRIGLNEYIYSDGEWKTIKMNAWDLNGNFNTNPATQFIGTTDKNVVVFKRFNTERLRIAEEGLQIKAGNTLEFGAGTTGKQTDNGKIGYNTFGETNTLSIVGGGVSATGADRRIKMWADLGTDFTGGALFNKNVGIRNSVFNMLSFTNTNALAAGTTHLLSFGGTNYTTGLISVIGTSSSEARMGFSTGYSFAGGVSNMQERLSISNVGNVGIGQITPVARLDVAGKIKIADDFNLPIAGNIRYNNVLKDFEGFDGNVWISLTKNNQPKGWDVQITNEKQILTTSDATPIGTVSIDENSAFIGAPAANKVFVYQKINDKWVQTLLIAPPGLSASDKFGWSVSVKDSIAVVGSPGYNNNGGKIYVYRLLAGNWVFHYDYNNTSVGDQLGYRVYLIDGGVWGYKLWASRPYKTVGGNINQGDIMRFGSEDHPLGYFLPDAYITVPDGAANDRLGLYDFAANELIIIVGLPFKNSNGKVYYIKYLGGGPIGPTTGWQTVATINSPTLNSKLGYSIARGFGDAVAIGSPVSFSSGVVYIYQLQTNSFSLLQTITSSEVSFGSSVSMSSGYLLIGGNIGGANNNGICKIYKRTSSTNWNFISDLIQTDQSGIPSNGNFGDKIKLSEEGTALISGGGKVYFFNK